MKSIIVLLLTLVLFSPVIVFAEGTSSEKTILSPKEIPSWIKNTAAWWSEDIISDEEFLEAISFLKNSEIIKITNIEKTSILNYTEAILNYSEINSEIEKDDGITILYSSISEALENPENSKLHLPLIEGNVENNKSKIPITISVTKPNGKQDITKTITRYGQYSTPIFLKGDELPGIYTIEITRGDVGIIETKYTFLGGNVEKIPSWIKNNASWWTKDQISDEDFLQGIKFLVKTNMIKPPKLTSSSVDAFSMDSLPDFTDPMSFLNKDGFTKTNLNIIDPNESRQECMHRIITAGLGTSANLSKCKKIVSEKMDEYLKPFSDESYSAYDSSNSELINKIAWAQAEFKANEIKKKIKSISDRSSSNKASSNYESPSKNYLNNDYYDYYDYGYSNYGYSDADVQRYLDRADYYANQWLNNIEPYAQQWVNGQISYDEYERIGMQSFDYYSDQFVNEYMGSYP
jgi:hypothetical protein